MIDQDDCGDEQEYDDDAAEGHRNLATGAGADEDYEDYNDEQDYDQLRPIFEMKLADEKVAIEKLSDAAMKRQYEMMLAKLV